MTMKKIFYAAALILVAACSGGQKETRESDGQNAPGKDASAGETKKEVYVISYTTTDKQPVALTKPDGFGDAKILRNEYFADKDSGAIVLDSEPKAIEAGTFAGNATLKSIEIPKYVMRIEPFAFKECINLTDVIFSSRFFVEADSYLLEAGSFGVPYRESFEKTIMPNAFFGCRNLANVSKNTFLMSKAYSFNGCFGLPMPAMHNGVYGCLKYDDAIDLPKIYKRNVLKITVADKNMLTIEMGRTASTIWWCKDGVWEVDDDPYMEPRPVSFGEILDDFVWNRHRLEIYPIMVEKNVYEMLDTNVRELRRKLKPYEDVAGNGEQLPKYETELVNAKIKELNENIDALYAVKNEVGTTVTVPEGIMLSIVYDSSKDYDTYLSVSEMVFAAIKDVYHNAAKRFFNKDYDSCSYAQKVFVENACSIQVATYDSSTIEKLDIMAPPVPLAPKPKKSVYNKVEILEEKPVAQSPKSEMPAEEVVRVDEIYVDEGAEEEELFDFVEDAPEFPGGAKALNDYLSSNIKYPRMAREMGAQGRVFLRFVVKKDGSVSGIEVIKSSGEKSLDDEALRVVRSMPKWNPGRQGGKAVNAKYTLPVNFRLH